MRRSARGLLTGPWVGACFALLTVVVVWSQPARAGCSAHYLRQAETVGALRKLEVLTLAGTATPAPVEAPRERPAPCTGAFCSGQPAPPLSTPPLAPPPWTGHWALLLSCPGNGGCRRVRDRRRSTPAVVLTGSLFRPPRTPLS
ncbi:MAG: hypothetical protein U0794_21445 [Isosphaeraceae bacterium]